MRLRMLGADAACRVLVGMRGDAYNAAAIGQQCPWARRLDIMGLSASLVLTVVPGRCKESVALQAEFHDPVSI